MVLLLHLLSLLVERHLLLVLGLHDGARDRMSLLLLLSKTLVVGTRALAGGMEVLRDEVGGIMGIGIIVIIDSGSVGLLGVH